MNLDKPIPTTLRLKAQRNFLAPIPLSLYIHIPWCIKKCPYCDFNSHQQPENFTELEEAYVSRLLQDLEESLPLIWGRPLHSIFIGGGTPSLFSAKAIEKILDSLRSYFLISPDLEITLEANPGTFEQEKFSAYRKAGINRLPIGIQSFNAKHLKSLGRVHDELQAHGAITTAMKAGFDNINLDLMHGLPEQNIKEALEDLTHALSYKTSHISWYQLTLEPNTWFYQHPPKLPEEDGLAEIQEQGQKLLAEHDFHAYEVSAYTKNRICKHNQNYWEFGDYLGIGAGAHSKLTNMQTNTIERFVRVRHPKAYLDQNTPFIASSQVLGATESVFEFMLNSLRLSAGVPKYLFSERLGLQITPYLENFLEAEKLGLLKPDPDHILPTELGKRFLNDLVALFLPK